MKGISDQEFLQKNLLHIANIEEGFQKYEYAILSGTEAAYKEFIECAVSMNGEENCYFDFYYTRLKKEEKNRLYGFLTEQERKLIDGMEPAESIYYPLTEEWIPLAAKVTAKEQLFSTFYFGRYPCTLWGNYGLRYPVFFKDKGIRKIYGNAALACGLCME